MGDRREIERVYERHGPATQAFLRRQLRDQRMADDALQETFLAVWRSGTSFAGRSTVRTWILSIARRQAWGRLRKEPPGTEPLLDVTDQGQADAVVAAASRADLEHAMAQLPDHHREVILLVFGQDLSLADAAEVLGVALGTVKSRLARARTTLAELLALVDTGDDDR